MNTYADKTSENKIPDVNKSSSKQQSSAAATHLFTDNRPVAIAQREMRETLNNSPRVQQLKAYQELANDSHQTKQQLVSHKHPIQKKVNNTGLPDHLKSGVENLSGFNMDDVKVHYNSEKPAELQAHAYAQGTDIHIGHGQEKHLPHEAWHVVQQKQGRVRPTLQMKGIVNVNDDSGLENEADVMGVKAFSFSDNHPEAIQMQAQKSVSFGPVIQLASMYILIGTREDQEDLAGNTSLAEKELGLTAKKIATANLGGITAADTLYLGGAHGNSSTFGPYNNGKELSDALFAKGLRVCKTIVLTGCDTGNAFSGQFYEAATAKGIDIKDYITAPKTYGIVREGGRIVAYTPERMQIEELQKQSTAAFKNDPFDTKIDEIYKQIIAIREKEGYWEYVESPIQMAEELDENYDSLDRAYEAHTTAPDSPGMPYDIYEGQFNDLKRVSQPRLRMSASVWTIHGKPEVGVKFRKTYDREPLKRKVWDLSGLNFW